MSILRVLHRRAPDGPISGIIPARAFAAGVPWPQIVGL